MNELTDSEVARMFDNYRTVLLERDEVTRVRREFWKNTAAALLFLGLAFLLWRVW